jgi:translation initiation factor IF-1
MFRVAIDMPQDQKHIIIAYLSGKMKQKRIKVISGDKVEVEIAEIDPKGKLSLVPANLPSNSAEKSAESAE